MRARVLCHWVVCVARLQCRSVCRVERMQLPAAATAWHKWASGAWRHSESPPGVGHHVQQQLT